MSNGSFILSRTDDPNHPISQSLTVNVSVSGAGRATPGQDYQFISSQVTFAAGSATATVTVNVMGSPYNDSYVENDEMVILNIAGPGQNYSIGTPSSATVIIVDNDTNAHDYYWTGEGGNPYWSTPANWTLDTSPAHTPASDARTVCGITSISMAATRIARRKARVITVAITRCTCRTVTQECCP